MAKEKREHYEKIIKKEKDGVTILFFIPEKKSVKVSWEEFNEVYEIRKDEPFKAYMKKEYSEKVKESNKYFSQAFVHYMRLNAMKEDENDTERAYHHEKSMQWEGYNVQTAQMAERQIL